MTRRSVFYLALFLMCLCSIRAHARSWRIVTDAALNAEIPKLLKALETRRATEGWTVQSRIIARDFATTRARLLADGTSQVLLIGDSVAVPSVMLSPDGHDVRPQAAANCYLIPSLTYDTARNMVTPSSQPGGAVGVVNFKFQPGTAKKTTELYTAYINKLLAWNPVNFPEHVRIYDRLHYPGYSRYGDNARKRCPVTPAGLLQYVYAPACDHAYKDMHDNPVLMGVCMDGGQPFINPGGLINMGGYNAWTSANPNVGIVMWWGSFLSECYWSNALIVRALISGAAVASIFDWSGLFDYGLLFTPGKTLGDAYLSTNASNPNGLAGTAMTQIYGDPAISLAPVAAISSAPHQHRTGNSRH